MVHSLTQLQLDGSVTEAVDGISIPAYICIKQVPNVWASITEQRAVHVQPLLAC
jgi:hypothetical protein